MCTPRAFRLAVYFTCLTVLGSAAPTVSKPEVIAYVFVKDRVIQPGEIAASELTRINYAFSNIENGKMLEGFAHDADNFAALNALKRKNPDLKILVSVGGWTWSKNFSDVSLTKDSRKVFIDSVMSFLDRYQLDGLDIDWEYPGMSGDNNRFRPEDKQNYTKLIHELRQRFDRQGKSTRKHLALSIATGSSDEVLRHTEMHKVQKYLDTVNLMAYDYYEPDSDTVTGNHAPLFTDPADPKHVSADVSVRHYLAAGVPSHKIVLGVPFYGHVWGDVADVSHGLFQPGKAAANAFSSYGHVSTHMQDGFERFWDKAASVPYMYSSRDHVFVSYEDPESLGIKCEYVLQHHLGGIMFWDYSGDAEGTLLRTINSKLAQQ
jgi:chitinase